MDRIRCSLIAALAAAALAAAPAAPAAEEILHFASEIAIAADGHITVTESVTVNAEGDRIRRGIYRDIPTRYVDAEGRPTDIPFELLSVRRDGEVAPHRIEPQEDSLRIYIGAADKLLAPGEYTFELVYRTSGQIRPIEGHGTLSWNVTGDWDFPIRKAQATIQLPAPVAEHSLQTAAYTGTHDARRKDYTVEIIGPGVIRFESTQPLGAREGFVVAVVFPADVVQPPVQESLELQR